MEIINKYKYNMNIGHTVNLEIGLILIAIQAINLVSYVNCVNCEIFVKEFFYFCLPACDGCQFQRTSSFCIIMFLLFVASCVFPPIKTEDLPSCSSLKTYDYFAGNEFAFIFSWIWIGLFPFGKSIINRTKLSINFRH